MNGLSVGVAQSISNLNEAQAALATTISNFRNASQEINTSSSKFGESQLLFSKHSNEFLQNNSSTIDEIQKSLVKAKDVSADYAQKFEIIEKGLQDIFAKITVGLKDYQETVSGSLETYLGKYTEALTKTAESLAGASSKQEDILEELTEQLSKLNARRN
jgi:chromosome segregation ATPase